MASKSTLYIDESGKSSLAEKQNEPFILTGVIINDEDFVTVQGFFNYIKKKFNIDSSTPFHSFHIFENTDTKLDDSTLKQICNVLSDFLSLIPIKILVIKVDKENFSKSLGVQSDSEFKGTDKVKKMREFPYEIMSAKLFSWFANYLEEQDRIGQIVADSRVGGDVILIKTLNNCCDPDHNHDLNDLNRIKNRVNAICFAGKNYLSGGIEITDLISYITFFYVRNLTNNYNQINIPKVWKSIKETMDTNDVVSIKDEEIKKYFKISNGVHKYLVDLRRKFATSRNL